ALEVEAGRPPTADVPLLAPALAAAAPEGATLEPRRLVEVRDLLAAARQVRAYLRRDPARFSRLAAEGEAIDPVPEVAEPRAAPPPGSPRGTAARGPRSARPTWCSPPHATRCSSKPAGRSSRSTCACRPSGVGSPSRVPTRAGRRWP